MQKVSGRKMTEPLRLRLYTTQRTELEYLSLTNHEEGLCKLARIGVDLLTHVSRLNGGQIPLFSQIKLQRQLVRRAHLDSRRKQNGR